MDCDGTLKWSFNVWCAGLWYSAQTRLDWWSCWTLNVNWNFVLRISQFSQISYTLAITNTIARIHTNTHTHTYEIMQCYDYRHSYLDRAHCISLVASLLLTHIHYNSYIIQCTFTLGQFSSSNWLKMHNHNRRAHMSYYKATPAKSKYISKSTYTFAWDHNSGWMISFVYIEKRRGWKRTLEQPVLNICWKNRVARISNCTHFSEQIQWQEG